MYIKELTASSIDQYYPFLCHTFEPDVLKSKENIVELFSKGKYKGYGVFSDLTDALLGFALVYVSKRSQIALLDYIMVRELERGNGYGKYLLRAVQLEYSDKVLVAEVQYTELSKLKSFYELCGMVDTGCLSVLYGVCYQIMHRDVVIDFDIVLELQRLYEEMYSSDKYKLYAEVKKEGGTA